ncbi:DUF2829 domain-containing protein [Lactiplantibacillus xiangfangensis]|uniref:DUF2829 domain-containing protein n=1 Tax=Lactiplantibacillus xiangfangensis TaxID=942150 RepID=UPI00384B2FBD
MDFGQALKELKRGKRLARKGWNGKGIFIKMQKPDKQSFMTHEYIYIDTTGLNSDNEAAPKDRVPWLASQTDMLADDWEVVGNRLTDLFQICSYSGNTAQSVASMNFFTSKVDLIASDRVAFEEEINRVASRLVAEGKLVLY